MAVAVGQRCVARIKITDIDLRKAKDIMAIIVSPQCEEKCQDVSFDEVSGLVYVTVDVKSVGAWSMWLGVRFANEAVYTPAFVFAEVEGEAKPCDAPYIVDVQVSGESVTVTPPKIDVDAVTQEEFDALASKVESKVDKVEGKGLSTNDFTDEYKKKVDEFSIDTELSPTSDNAIANSAVVQGLAGLAEGVSEAIGNVAKNVAQNTADIKTKQGTLTLTTKPNGNIVIGNLAGQSKEFMPATPSGDPMHYAYEAVGAVWNASTGYWELNGITDIDNAEMRDIYEHKYASLSTYYIGGWWASGYRSGRTNVCMACWSQAKNLDSVFVNNNAIEVVSLAFSPSDNALPISMGYTFAYTNKLRQVMTTLNLNYYTKIEPNTYMGAYALEEIRITNLRTTLDFRWSPLLSKESLLYMINNCASNATLTITLHPDVYAKCQENGEWYSEVNTALSAAQSGKTTTITLASA